MNLSIRTTVQLITSIFVGCGLGLMIISGLPWNYIVGLLVVTGFIVVFFANPLVSMAALLFMRAGIDYFLVNIRFGNLGLGGGLSLLLIGLVLMAFLVGRDSEALAKINHPLVKLYAFYCFFSIFNATYTEDKAEALKILLRNFTILILIIWPIMEIKNEKEGYFLLKAIAWSFLPSIVLGHLSGHYTINEARGVRYCASLSHPNILADYLLIIMAAFATKLHFAQDSSRSRIFTAIGLIILISMLIFTKTRSGLIAGAAMFLLYSWFNNRRLILPTIAVCACLMMMPFVSSGLTGIFEVKNGRVELNESDNFTWRLQKSALLFEKAAEQPVFGQGFGASKKYNTGESAQNAHNDYAQFLVDSGIVGLCLYFGPFFYMLIQALKTRKKTDKKLLINKISNFFLIATPAFLLMSMSDNLNNYIIIQWYYWVIAGVFISLSWRMKRART